MLPPPKFNLGDWVVHVLDIANEPNSEFYDHLDPRPRFFRWMRGVITGTEYNLNPEFFSDSTWFYKVLIAESEYGDCYYSPPPIQDLFNEDELKLSPYAKRFINEMSLKIEQP